MATEKKLKEVLDLLTLNPGTLDLMSAESAGHAVAMKTAIANKNVVGVGISEKISNNKKTGKLAITFYVEKKKPLNKMKASELIPPAIGALKNNTLILTDVVEVGKIKAQAAGENKSIQPGNSIGHFNILAGTLGAIVTDGKAKYFLSNSHVLADSGSGSNGDAILYPGKEDGGTKTKNQVATLHKFIPFQPGDHYPNEVDCAIAKPLAEKLPDIIDEIHGLGLPKGTIKAVRGMKIVKVGRTTGKTQGEIKDVNFRTSVKYGNKGTFSFTDQILCTRYTEGGDSGSLVIDKKSGKAVGLHFSGGPYNSVCNPIDKVLSALNVRLVTSAKAQTKAKKKAAKRRK